MEQNVSADPAHQRYTPRRCNIVLAMTLWGTMFINPLHRGRNSHCCFHLNLPGCNHCASPITHCWQVWNQGFQVPNLSFPGWLYEFHRSMLNCKMCRGMKFHASKSKLVFQTWWQRLHQGSMHSNSFNLIPQDVFSPTGTCRISIWNIARICWVFP